MVFHIGHQSREAFPLMMAGTAIMNISESSLDRVGLGTVGRQQEKGEQHGIIGGACLTEAGAKPINYAP
jgi:hypothetical protein